MQKKNKMWLVVLLPDSETSKNTCLSMIVKVETCGQHTASKSWESTDFQGSELEPASKCRYSIWGSSTNPLIHSKYCWLICASTCQQAKICFRLKLIHTYYCFLICTSTHLQHELSQLPPLLPHTSCHVLGYQDPCPGVLISIGVMSRCADQYIEAMCADHYWNIVQVCWLM